MRATLRRATFQCHRSALVSRTGSKILFADTAGILDYKTLLSLFDIRIIILITLIRIMGQCLVQRNEVSSINAELF